MIGTIEEALAAYVDCAIWTSTVDEEGTPMDRDYGPDDLATETWDKMREELTAFCIAQCDDLMVIDSLRVGHDLWLTRNGHGAGFWDRGLGAVGDRLTEACKRLGEVDLYVGDDGKVYQLP